MIHKFQFHGENIVMDVNSGAVHVLEPVAYALLDHYEGGLDRRERRVKRGEAMEELSGRFPREEMETAWEELSRLEDDGALFADDYHVTNDMLENRGSVIKAMCLHVAHDCNLRCSYCFADKGAFCGDRSLMSLETGKKAIDFLLEQSGGRRNLELDFFGGEPLMNFDVVKELVAYGREREKEYGKNIRFTITTNGVLLDQEKSAFINGEMSNVILSIDGRPEVNDRMRKTVNGKGSYDCIIKNYKDFVQKREGLYYVRGTFTKDNLDFAEDVKHLADLGFRNVSVEPVVTDPSVPFAILEEDEERILKEYDRLAELYLDYAKQGKEFSFFHFNVDLEQGPCVYKRVAGCGAGTEYVAVSPEGDIYPCHQFVGNEDFLLGNVNGPAFENRLYDTFNKAHIYNKSDCRLCWAKFYCSGGCHANAYFSNGDIRKPYHLGCLLERKRLECAIGIQAVLAGACREEA